MIKIEDSEEINQNTVRKEAAEEAILPFTADSDITIVEAMERIDRNARGILYITDNSGRLLGSLSDGDIRRWIIRTGNLKGTAGQCMHRDVRYLLNRDEEHAAAFMEAHRITSVPIVDEQMRVLEICFAGSFESVSGPEYNSSQLRETPVIIMAGGKGTRLYPFTRILPKPLIPIGDVPILERIMDRFHGFGADEFWLTVNYKKEMIKSYFHELNPDYRIHYVEEEHPLGTAGSIRLIRDHFTGPVIITNCDILIEADYGKIMMAHHQSGNDMTIVSSLKKTVIPYGVLQTGENGLVKSMEEKPVISHLINTGMYVVNPGYLAEIPEDTVFHMTDLAGKMIEEGRKVGIYPISENAFLDMGQMEEMKKMEERLGQNK